MKDIIFAGQNFQLTPDGILIWPEQSMAIVADLHLEKGSHFAMKGQLIPIQDSIDTLTRLKNTLDPLSLTTVIFLGDTFHDDQGFHRMEESAAKSFDNLCSSYDILWVIGNHDGSFIPPKTKGVEEMKIENIVFRHEAKSDFEDPEISGHYHPKASLRLRGSRVSRPCFIMDENRMILPAFGSYTGGLDIKDKVIRNLFGQKFIAQMLGDKKIYSVPSEKFL